jgi:outer membrane lipoprotein
MTTTWKPGSTARRRLFAAFLFLLPACVYHSVIPEELETQVDWNLPFEHLVTNPAHYEGKMVCFGGEVLSARRLEQETRVEIFQLPLDGGDAPRGPRSFSQGRFLAYQRGFLDPAALPPRTRVTVVGVVRGPETAPLDESQYTFPAIELRHLIVWTGPPYAPPRAHLHIGFGGVFVR